MRQSILKVLYFLLWCLKAVWGTIGNVCEISVRIFCFCFTEYFYWMAYFASQWIATFLGFIDWFYFYEPLYADCLQPFWQMISVMVSLFYMLSTVFFDDKPDLTSTFRIRVAAISCLCIFFAIIITRRVFGIFVLIIQCMYFMHVMNVEVLAPKKLLSKMFEERKKVNESV